MLRPAAFVMALVATAACSGEEPPNDQAPPPELEQPPDIAQPTPEAAERYPMLYDPVADDSPEARASLPFTRLLLRREGCYGTCPVYEVEFRRDGAARYTGGAFAPREGSFEGRVWLYDYALLCAAAEDLAIESLQTSYHSDWTDQETVILEWERNGQVRQIEDYGKFAPPAFHAYRALFDEIASRVEWRRAQESR
jgi:hypothetical protein